MKRLVYFSAIFMVISIAIILFTFEHYNKLDIKCRVDIEYAYEIQLQPGDDYLIKQHGLPILYCKKTSY
ncbi:hypothetical protein [Klebsiella huaxiensis]|uniref:Uncharacterized protein n=1 Tax=Klebsiella huaxiensis TaxID=2153354 RepID=A0A564NL17_9ENTR|nr:hypothetical protein [Klebsiella huaxiensis]VUT06255.1 hypothetical protein SB6422_03899 [Klebsiella huaxiensis]